MEFRPLKNGHWKKVEWHVSPQYEWGWKMCLYFSNSNAQSNFKDNFFSLGKKNWDHLLLSKKIYEHFCCLGIWKFIKNFCVCSDLYTYAEHTCQERMGTLHTSKELMCTLSIQVRNWCVRWAYIKGTDAWWAFASEIKWCLTWDFRLQVFFMNQCPPGPQVFHWGRF